jgi:lysophospholipase L1-like esterase
MSEKLVFLVIYFLILCYTPPLNFTEVKCSKIKWKKFIVLGDSNTQMGFGESQWLTKIADLFQRKCDIINRGFGGYNSTTLKLMLKQLFSEFENDEICGVLILIGTNDSTNEENELQHVPTYQFKKNLESILDYIAKIGVNQNKTILISPPRKADFMSDFLLKEYAKISKIVANEKRVSFIDLYNEMHLKGDESYNYLSDGLHFSLSGGEFLLQKLNIYLKNNILSSSNIVYPDWNDIKTNLTLLNFCDPI